MSIRPGSCARRHPAGERSGTDVLFPFLNFDSIELADANRCLREWGHRMGELHRPANYGPVWCHGLFHESRLVGVCTTSKIIRERVGGCPARTRENTVELSRMCADRPSLCRVVLRLWREFVFPNLGFPWAISYQDSALHSGNLYRFDGWQRFPLKSRSGFDARSGRAGRSKWIWGWPVDPSLRATWEVQEAAP